LGRNAFPGNQGGSEMLGGIYGDSMSQAEVPEPGKNYYQALQDIKKQ
jgi:hypothetical protein